MDPVAEPRRLLGAFLRARREASRPIEGGAGRRRTPGLRREDVAQLCGISTTWYTWLEQGREITLSATALARLATALALTPAERAYLFELTRRRDPAPAPTAPAWSDISSDLARALDAIAAPAYLLDAQWEALAWNPAALDLFEPWLGGADRNLLRFVFLEPAAQRFIVDWEERARRVLAEFRADLAHRPNDPALLALVNDLCRSSPFFAKAWTSHAVLARDGGRRLFDHPRRGRMQFEQVTLLPATRPSMKIVLLLPPA